MIYDSDKNERYKNASEWIICLKNVYCKNTNYKPL